MGHPHYLSEEERKAISEKEEAEKVQRTQELEDIQAVLETPAGFRFFKRFFKEGFIFSTTFTGNSEGFFKEGHRNLALRFFKDVTMVAPERLKDLIFEEGKNK